MLRIKAEEEQEAAAEHTAAEAAARAAALRAAHLTAVAQLPQVGGAPVPAAGSSSIALESALLCTRHRCGSSREQESLACAELQRI